jgi:hypothetical protein
MVPPLRRLRPAGRRVGRLLHLRRQRYSEKSVAMTLRLGALHDALLNAGAQPELAQRAAEELANYDRQLNEVRSDLLVLKWMVATTVALQLMTLGGLLGLLWKVFPR